MATLPKSRWVDWAAAYLVLGQIQALSVVDRVLYGEWMAKPGDKLTQIMNILQIFVSLALFCRGLKYWSNLRKGGIISILLAIFLISSAVWSINSGATERAGVNYLFFIIGVIGVAENIDGDDFMHLLAWVCFLSALASLVLLAVSARQCIRRGRRFPWRLFSEKILLARRCRLERSPVFMDFE